MAYKIEADMHIHTLRSETGYSTLLENIISAKNRGLKGICIADYGPKDRNTNIPKSILNFNDYVPSIVEGITVYNGIEANITNLHNGEIDLNNKRHDTFDWIISSYHPISEIDEMILDFNNTTKMYASVASDKDTMVLGHIDRLDFDFGKVIDVCKKYGKIIELNEYSIEFPQNYARAIEIVELCKEKSVFICVSSGAHIATEVGNFTLSTEILEKTGFPQELIINSSIQLIDEYIKVFMKDKEKRII